MGRAGGHEQHGIDKAHMVARQNGRAGGRNVLVTPHLEAVDEARHHPGHKAQQVFRHQQEDVGRHHRVGNAGEQKDLRHGEARTQQGTSDDGAADHEQRVQDVVGRDDAGAVRGLAAHLDEVRTWARCRARQTGSAVPGPAARASGRAAQGRRQRPSSRQRAGCGWRSTGPPQTRSCRWRPAARSPISTWRRDSTSHRSDPTPMPTENTTSSSEATCSLPAQHLLARAGNCDRNTAPKNHIQLMPKSERNTTTLPCASLRLRQVSVKGFQLMTRWGSVAGAERNELRHQTPGQRQGDAAHGHGEGDQRQAGPRAGHRPPDRARWPRRCPSPHHAVAACQLALVQHLGM